MIIAKATYQGFQDSFPSALSSENHMVSKKCLPLGYYSNFTVLLPSVHRPLGWPRKALPGLHEFAFFESMTFMRTIIPWSCWNHQTKTSRKDLYTDANRGVSLKELSQRRRSGYSCGAHMEPVHCYNAAFLPHRVVCTPWYSLAWTMSTDTWFLVVSVQFRAYYNWFPGE